MNPNNNTNAGVLKGNLNQFHLVELVQAMDIDGSSGALELTHTDGRRGIMYFEEGALVMCREYDQLHPQQTLSIGMVLQQLNLVGTQIIESFAARSASDPLGELLGQQLVESHKLTVEELRDALRTQMIWTVREMARWDSGQYQFKRGAASPLRSSVSGVQAAGQYDVPPVEASRLTLEIVRYQYEWEDLRQWLPMGMSTKLRLVASPPQDHQLIFAPPVWRLLIRVNAYQTPRLIATALHQPELETARMLAPLVYDGLLTINADESSQTTHLPARTIKENNDVDLFTLISKMLQEWSRRKSLTDKLASLALFINWTMKDLEQRLTQNQRKPLANSLLSLLRREHCDHLGTYELHVVSNQIDIDHLTAFLRNQMEVARRSGGTAVRDFTWEVFSTLRRALIATFATINRRIEEHEYRHQNETTWTQMFDEFEASIKHGG